MPDEVAAGRAGTQPQPDRPLKEGKGIVFAKRLSSTLVLWGLVAGAVILSNATLFFVLIGVLGMLSLVEFFQMQEDRGLRPYRNAVLVLAAAYFITTFVCVSTGHAGQLERVDTWGLVAAVLVTFGVAFTRELEGQKTLLQVCLAILGFVYIPVLFTFMTKLVALGETPRQGALYALFLIAVTKFTDMGAYAVGTWIGKHKLVPHISPGKTWQGLGGAVLGALVAGCGLYALLQDHLVLLDWPVVVVSSVLLGGLAVAGDLAESVLKRCAGAKDSGRMLPGIGGALDLIDSLLFTAPVFYFYLSTLT